MRPGVSCAVAIVIVLGTVPIVPLLFPDGATASAGPLMNPDEDLFVTDRYEVTGYEVWRQVHVQTTGALVVREGGRLVTEAITLHGNAMFSVLGAMVEVSPTDHRRVASISGTCAYFEVEDHSVVRVWGPDGGYDVPSSMGCSAVINVTASWYVEVLDAGLREYLIPRIVPDDRSVSDRATRHRNHVRHGEKLLLAPIERDQTDSIELLLFRKVYVPTRVNQGNRDVGGFRY